MNIKYHVACGILLDLSLGTRGIMVLCSLLPDLPLVGNELRLWRTKSRFNENEVKDGALAFYLLTHSLLILPIIYYLFGLGVVAYGVHIVADWFTHTGRFSAKPFYPLCSYTLRFGKEFLK
jgi:membrane-bound metal-dependent hydrolase YbcI (DUF457 family)